MTSAAAVDAQCLCKWDPSISCQTPNKGEHNSWLFMKTSSALPRAAQSLCYRNRSGGANCPLKNKNLHPPFGIGLSIKAPCRPLLYFPSFSDRSLSSNFPFAAQPRFILQGKALHEADSVYPGGRNGVHACGNAPWAKDLGWNQTDSSGTAKTWVFPSQSLFCI